MSNINAQCGHWLGVGLIVGLPCLVDHDVPWPCGCENLFQMPPLFFSFLFGSFSSPFHFDCCSRAMTTAHFRPHFWCIGGWQRSNVALDLLPLLEECQQCHRWLGTKAQRRYICSHDIPSELGTAALGLVNNNRHIKCLPPLERIRSTSNDPREASRHCNNTSTIQKCHLLGTQRI